MQIIRIGKSFDDEMDVVNPNKQAQNIAKEGDLFIASRSGSSYPLRMNAIT